MNHSRLLRSLSSLIPALMLLLAACQPVSPQSTYGSETSPENLAQVEVNGPLVLVKDQPSDGSKVVIENVISKGPGWVVIHIQENGKIGPTIGYAALDEGLNQNVVVELEAGRATEVMYAMLHVDAGQVGVYEFPGVDVPEAGLAQDVSPDFRISDTAAGVIYPMIVVEDQAITDGTVTISRVVSASPGWIVIYDDHGGSLGDAVGWAAVKAGETLDVSVPVDPTHLKEKMIAKLHQDAGVIGTLELPSKNSPDGADVPETIDGDEVLLSFQNTNLSVANAQQTLPGEGGESGSPSETGAEGHGGEHGQVGDAPGTDQSPSIRVSDQIVGEGFILVDEVFSIGPGWVVIYADDGGQPGEKIGLIAILNGQNQDVLVAIDPAKATPLLYAVLHQDTGQSRVFEFPNDDQPVQVDIRQVQAIFSTSGQAAEGTDGTRSDVGVRADDQPLRGGTVTIAEVFSQGPGWIGVHISNADGSLSHTAAIGAGHLENGLNTNLVIKLTNPARATQTMYAMLHTDAGEIGTYEFPGGPDVPVEIPGAATVDSFKILAGLDGQDTTIGVRNSEDTPFLVDAAGFSLYSLSFGDCNAVCQVNWLPLLVTGKLVAGEGVEQGKLGVIGLGDGNRQVTYGNLPLYYFYNDFNPGETKGQGVDGQWFLARP